MLFPLAFLSLSLSLAIAFDDNSQFLFNNAAICGEPFADPMWIPVLDMCDISCDPLKEYCVENDELKQMCRKMPDECQRGFSEYLARKWTKSEGRGIKRRYDSRL
ncbi:hypothetical protein PENTCL1PPCAC_10907 [Pristionchus entomophagus]|uniref:Uncharacterized protein n=1 Tax=Pristionchus entomophagus TaxID=358040 RepID=A0AAV5T176_9BILA|nr:hypothetical protein PENTCL1PPCAC_10907 [Pristionchus entomophagus]